MPDRSCIFHPPTAMLTGTSKIEIATTEAVIAGEAVRVRCFVSAATDVLVLEIDDQRPEPQPVRLTISLWRAPRVVNGNHVAQYEFAEPGDAAIVVQRFHEKDYHCAAAVAARFVAETAKTETATDKSRTLIIPAKQGKQTILISSAASWLPDANVGATAVENLDDAAEQTYDDLRSEHVRWWHSLDRKSVV